MSSKEFEIARLAILQSYLDGHLRDETRAFAWAARIFPPNPSELEEIFADDFKLSREDVGAVWKAIDEGELSGKRISFYDLESKFDVRSGYGNIDRIALINICRLASIDRRFDQETWHALTVSGSGPIESQRIANAFDPADDLDF